MQGKPQSAISPEALIQASIDAVNAIEANPDNFAKDALERNLLHLELNSSWSQVAKDFLADRS